MDLIEQIQDQLRQLPPEKQSEVMDFIAFLQQRTAPQSSKRQGALRDHPAFGSWKQRKINALQYQENIRAEWDNHL